MGLGQIYARSPGGIGKSNRKVATRRERGEHGGGRIERSEEEERFVGKEGKGRKEEGRRKKRRRNK
jgi:hypothetical protein